MSSLPTVTLAKGHLRRMLQLMRTLYSLQQLPAYRQRLAQQLPEVARFDPGHDSVMMGYDFHLQKQGPQLIEVNTNAGGALLAWRAYDPDFPGHAQISRNKRVALLLATFSQELSRFSAGSLTQPRRLLIVDDEPEKQYLAEEMHTLCELFAAQGVEAALADPRQLQGGEEGVFWQGKRVDLIYNRHCDFYLETPAMAPIRAAYLARQICLTPNPRSYALLADKRRMILWQDTAWLASVGVSPRQLELLQATIPACQLLANLDQEQLWQQRKQWVFKPVTAFGSRGVLLGDSISRQRFHSLDPQTTLVQRFIPPSQEEATHMKVDWRLFVYQNRLLGVAPRLYRGQVTNFRQPGSGYAPIRLQNE
ncbi:hypothetical protein [Candidatus Magnetaquicoccus inordinatus]|uniref:hypothetical protein n=1 Tax=Candidatus Magnetaquicoccus inordinatus TaxID=2496818 RepID=UPI00102CF430|nr:hypothetical protein [Candidatus Magnetaquicoccus inordinatus]